MTEDALETAWSDVGSGDPERITHAVDAFRAVIPHAVVTEGEGCDAHRSALRGLAYALDQLDRPDEAREMYDALADVCGAALAGSGGTEGRRGQLIADRLHARAAALIVGQDPEQVSPARLAEFDALIAEGEQELGGAHGRVLWLLERRALWLTRRDPEEGLQAFDLLIARAAADEEGGANHLMALAAKAAELSRLDEDEQSALLWGRVLDGRRTLLGLEHELTLDAWWWRARTRLWSGDPLGSETDLVLLVPILQRVRGEDDPSTLEALRFRVAVLRSLRRHDAPGDDPLPLLRRIAVLETARYGPSSRQVLDTRIAAVEAGLDQPDPEAMPALSDEAHTIVEDASERGARSLVAVRARRMEARVLRAQSDADPSSAQAAHAKERATNRCTLADIALTEHTRHAQEGADTDRTDDETDVAGDRELFDELHLAHLDRAAWEDPLSAEAREVLRQGADRLARYDGEARRHEIALRDLLGARLREAGRGDDALAEYRRSLELETALAAEASSDSDHLVGATRLAQSVLAIGVTLRGLGRTQEGEEVLHNAITNAERDGVDPGVVDELRGARALALQELGRGDEAATQLRSLYEASGDVHHANDLAVVYLNSDRPAEAEALLRPVLARLEADGQAETASALRVLGNLALAACKLDRDAEAAAVYDRLYGLQVDVLGADHRDTLITMHNRAMEEEHLGRPVEAVRRFEHVLQRRTAVLGARDPYTLSTLHALADAVHAAGDRARARELREQVVTLSRDVLGPTHPQTLRRIRELDGLLAELGDAQADRDALAETTRSGFGGDARSAHVGAVSARSALRYADHLRLQQRFGDALVEYSKARDALADEGGVDWLQAERGMAECARRLGADREAADGYIRIIPQLERLLPEDRWALAGTLNDLSLMLSNLGRIEEMVTAQQRAIQVADSTGSDPERAVQLRCWLGRRLAGAKRFAEALDAYIDTAEAAAVRLGAEHPLTLDAKDDQAETLIALGRHREAVRIYRKNIPAMQRVLGADSAPVRRARGKQKAAAAEASKIGVTIFGMLVLFAVAGYMIWTVLR